MYLSYWKGKSKIVCPCATNKTYFSGKLQFDITSTTLLRLGVYCQKQYVNRQKSMLLMFRDIKRNVEFTTQQSLLSVNLICKYYSSKNAYFETIFAWSWWQNMMRNLCKRIDKHNWNIVESGIYYVKSSEFNLDPALKHDRHCWILELQLQMICYIV
jgi:hypothetical protein